MNPISEKPGHRDLAADTVAVVLAGGPGAGLKGLTERRAKAAVPFGGTFRMIDFPLSNCINSGIRRISVLAQFQVHSLERHLRRGWSFLPDALGEFVDVLPPQPGVDGGWYTGTADAVYRNLDIIQQDDPSHVLILSGDQVCTLDVCGMIAAHAAWQADITVACIPVPIEEATAYGVLMVDETRRIVEFAERPEHPQPLPDNPRRALASMGIYVFRAGFLSDRLREDAGLETSSHDFGRDILPSAIRSASVFGFRFSKAPSGRPPYWRAPETLDAYWKAQMELVSGQPALDLFDAHWPIRTCQASLPPASFVSDEEGRPGRAVDSLVSGGCRIAGATVRRSVLSPGVRIHPGASVEESVVLSGVEVGRDAKLKRAILEEGVVIPEGMAIGHDPESDRRRFEVSEGGIVLVTPDRLG